MTNCYLSSWGLLCFEALSCLRVNWEKSDMLPLGEVKNLSRLAEELGSKVESLPTTYLRPPLGAKHKSSITWEGVEEKFSRKLAIWKRQYISKGGRVTLITSTISNLSPVPSPFISDDF